MGSADQRIAKTRAKRALQGLGFDASPPMVRAASTRNEVHVSDTHVVRINPRPDQRLGREGQLCTALPPESWAPSVVGYSGGTGFDFVVVERKPGIAVSRDWPRMDRGARRKFMGDLAAALRQLHSVPTPHVATKILGTPHLLDPAAVSPVVPILMAIDRLIAGRQVDRVMLDDLADMVNDHGDALNDYHQRTLIHGDLSFENIMVKDGRLSALLDFEWSRGAPADLELDVLFRFFRFPEAHVPPDIASTLSSLDFDEAPGWLAEDYPDLFSHPRLMERMALFSVAFDMAELITMKNITSASNMGPLHPVRRLTDLLDGLSPLRDQLVRLGLPA